LGEWLIKRVVDQVIGLLYNKLNKPNQPINLFKLNKPKY